MQPRKGLNLLYFSFIMLSLVFRRNGAKSVIIKINKDCFTGWTRRGFVHKFQMKKKISRKRKPFGSNKNP